MSLSISEVAARTGLSVHTLRFYEREQLLLHPIARAPGGHRIFCDDDVNWLKLCARLRDSGMPLPEIRRYAALVAAGEGNEAERLEVLREHQKRVNDQIAHLNNCLDVIDTKVGYYVESLAARTGDPLWSTRGWNVRCRASDVAEARNCAHKGLIAPDLGSSNRTPESR